MADYQVTATDIVQRTEDGAFIPNDPGNADRIEYEAWLADGGVPDPAPVAINPTLSAKPAMTTAQILGAT
ncbi:hypothetical protein [Bradyrhizobium cytisi]|uniref:hypothetical protein n=1 Tax=Bradyrhizobium cytisi TaxID=515489 RepID=UPI001652C9B3|nr:hypothetical protein [Bradyrhizobium cytisi]